MGDSMIFKLKRSLFKRMFEFLNSLKPDIDIFVMTRFNVLAGYQKKSPNIKVSGKSSLHTDETYLSERFELFEKYYIPSLLAQTDKNFKTVVYFHPATPQKFKNKISEYEKLFEGRFIPVFSEVMDTNVIKDFCKTKWIVTVRLDNDDAISNDFISSVRKYFVPIDKHFINFENGCCINNLTGHLYEYIYPSNHFMAFVEKLKKDRPVLSAYNVAHTSAKNKIRYFSLKNTHPMFMEVVHDLNVSNHTKKHEKDIDYSEVKNYFSINFVN